MVKFEIRLVRVDGLHGGRLLPPGRVEDLDGRQLPPGVAAVQGRGVGEVLGGRVGVAAEARRQSSCSSLIGGRRKKKSIQILPAC